MSLPRHILLGILCGVIAAATVLGVALYSIWMSLPVVRQSYLFGAKQSMVMLDRNGTELFRFYADEDRTVVPIGSLPPFVAQAFVAIEDRRFSERGCIDWRALGRAAVANVADFKSQGASTITQQLVRTVYLDREKTVNRKLREILLSCKLESMLGKEDILEQYLNWVSFGHGIAGVEQASRRFFGTGAIGLDLEKSVVLAAMPQRPSYFSPYGENLRTHLTPEALRKLESGSGGILENDVILGLLPSRVRIAGEEHVLPGRANAVLNAMRAQGYVTDEQARKTEQRLFNVRFRKRSSTIEAPHFVLSLKAELDQKLPAHDGAETAGVRVQTTLDLPLQHLAEEFVTEILPTVTKETNARNIALLAVDRATNEVRAYVGNGDFFDEEHGGQIDMIQTPRAAGSALKPFVYAELLEHGERPESRILDAPLDTDIYRPGPTGYYGTMTLRTALARSRNTPAIRAFYQAGGEDAVLSVLEDNGIVWPSLYRAERERAGIPFRYSWTLVLGSAEVTMLELAQGYSTFMHDGISWPIRAIRSVTDGEGDIVLTPDDTKRRTFLRSTAREITSILSDEEAREPSWRSIMHLPFGPAAMKTGTAAMCAERDFFGACRLLLPTSDWTVGYTDELLVIVWVGNADSTPMFENAGSSMVTTPIWQKFMIRAHALKTTEFDR